MLTKAVISTEDQRFYRHPGIDPLAIIRALRSNLAAGTIVQGGSTITQQLVKVRLFGHATTLPRKLREAAAAVWLDAGLSKDEILTRYLNSVYLGHGAYGMAAAARLYFDKPLSELTLPEAAVLAGLIKCPSQCNPLSNAEKTRARAGVVLDAMVDRGAIDAGAAKQAKTNPAALHVSQAALRASSWFADWAAREATRLSGPSSASLEARTTLIPQLQTLAEDAVNKVLAGPGAKHGATQAALVAMRPDGAVVAMVGGRDYRTNQFNRAVDAARQPGSAFKLFVYLAALRQGYSPSDVINASPVDIGGWEPENFGNRHHGRMVLAEAFAHSVNTAAVRLAQQVGLKEVINAARDLGLRGPLAEFPSLALGVADVNLLELTAAFAAVRVGKTPITPWAITGLGVPGEKGLKSTERPPEPARSLGANHEPMMWLLQMAVHEGTGRRAALPGFAAGKTGTTQEHRDAWFVGFNEDLVTGVWVGNDDHSPMKRVTGGSLPAQIWKEFMTGAMKLVARGELPPDSLPRQELSVEAPSVEASSVEAPTVEAPSGETPADAAAAGEAESGPVETPLPPSAETASEAQCNYDICASFYSSFDPADCTYQPFGGGPRRLCEKNAEGRSGWLR
jgi:1A family penicillin-binding protein